MPASVERTWELAFAADNALLDHRILKWLSWQDTTDKAIAHLLAAKDKNPTRADAARIDLRGYDNAYKYLCERYAQRDYDRREAVLAAGICVRYPYAKIVRVTREINGKSHAMAFLAACLETAKDRDLEDQRRDARVQELLQQSTPVKVPPKRFPGLMSGAIQEWMIDDEIARIVRGKRDA